VCHGVAGREVYPKTIGLRSQDAKGMAGRNIILSEVQGLGCAQKRLSRRSTAKDV
jgi:hypothetical protein